MFTNGWTLCLVLFGVCCLTPQGTDGIVCYQCSYTIDKPQYSDCLENLNWYDKSQAGENFTCQYGQECFVTYTIHQESNTVILGSRGCSNVNTKEYCYTMEEGGQTFSVCRRNCFYDYCNYWPVQMALTASSASLQPIGARVLLGTVAMYVYTKL